ncbi:histidine kinase CKI1-like isoform X2 [Silene latifolia]
MHMYNLGSIYKLQRKGNVLNKTLTVLLLPSILIPYWYQTVKMIKHNMEMEATYGIASRVDNAAKLVLPVNSSAKALASMLGSVHEHLLFSEVQSKVAPMLLEALLITPHSTQASYIGLDGLFFSYYKDDGDKIYAAYSNSTFGSSNSSAGGYTWYTQPVHSESGELNGKAKIMEPFIVINETWFQRAMNTSNGYASLGFSWINKKGDKPDLFLDTGRLGSAGVVSLGFAVKGITSLFSDINNLNGGSMYMATVGDDTRVLLQGMKAVRIKSTGDKALILGGNTDHIIGEVSCKTQNGVNVATRLNTGQTEHIFYCSQVDIARVELVYVFSFPSNGDLLGDVHKRTKVTMILLIVMMVAMLISIFVFVALIVRAAWREVQLCAAYMRQMDKTAQAERKSLKQSLAFASANHDVRGYLACIKGLLDLCYNDVQPSSELASNLKKIAACADDLLAMVNSILDFGKIEAGKMQLEEGRFNLEQLLEDITDLHHPVALKKGVDVILDPCDGSMLKFSSVIGDRGKLKQILGNLLSNAVKYTPSGHISIRAWAKKPSLENSIIASNKNSLLNRLTHIFYRNKHSYNNVELMRMSNEDSKSMEFVFEVEDTGLGIPIDKRKSIFEDFVQVKENSSGQTGTGLGLGIVQALVRLMGGDIEIVDKINGERGTCFKFNIFLTVEESESINTPWQDKVHNQDTYSSSELSSCVHSPRLEGSIVALLINNDERRSMVKRYMESLGIKVVVVRQVNQIPFALKNKVKFRLTNASQRYTSSTRSLARPTFAGTVRCVLLILDANAGDFQEMRRSVALFRKDNPDTCIKVVWLERPETRKAHFSGLADESLPGSDCIIQEPLHGHRLFRVIELLPEFGGELVKASRRKMSFRRNFLYNLSSDGEELYSSNGERPIYTRNDDTRLEVLDYKSSSSSKVLETTIVNLGEIEEESVKSSRLKNCSMSSNPSPGPVVSETQTTTDGHAGPSLNNKPLVGKRFLVAEDIPIGRMIATSLIKHLGGHAEVCENGREALELISKALNDIDGDVPSKFPYDFVLMDCQMPIMDGFEATRRIRLEERKYGIHIPVIALTANEPGETGNKITEAGMDLHMTKPLNEQQLFEALRLISSR